MPMETPKVEDEPKPVNEQGEKISYLGVALEKAKNRENAPRPEQYANYINDEFSLELQKKIAISFAQGDPILVEGGTSIGKTTTVRKMCSELGWEVHYANLNGATDVEDLMGRYIPNPKKTKEGDPEYVFADGKVTSGLRQEEDKIKVVILDEINASSPNILIRLHEVLDALERDAEVVLSEDASEVIGVNKTKTKVIALMNPPGKGFLQREPLDPAQLRRWVYQKEVTDLPSETFKNATDALFGLAPKTAKEVSKELYLRSSEAILTDEQLAEVPGMKEILDKYKEFHVAAKELVAKRKIAQDQPQAFTYDDRMEPERVRNFVQHFYRGDINETFQEALRYYYVGKILSETDKTKLEELINLVESSIAAAESKRRPLGSSPEKAKDFTAPEARAIFEAMGYGEAFFGPEEVEATFRFKLNAEQIPPVPFTKEQLEKAKELGMNLVLQVGKTPSGDALTIKKMLAILGNLTPAVGVPPNLHMDSSWAETDNVGAKDAPRLGWKLVTKDFIPDSTNKNYLEQTEKIIDFVKNKLYSGKEPSKRFADAIKDFEAKKPELARLLSERKFGDFTQMLTACYINNLTRELPCEVVYRSLLEQKKIGSVRPNKSVWTKGRSLGGNLTAVTAEFSNSEVILRSAPVISGVPDTGVDLSTMYL